MLETNIKELNEKIQLESAFVDMLTMEMHRVIVGQKHMIERLIIGLLSNGHILLEGVPGLAKTLAITFLLALLKVLMARIRIEQMINFCWKYLAPLAMAQVLLDVFLKYRLG